MIAEIERTNPKHSDLVNQVRMNILRDDSKLADDELFNLAMKVRKPTKEEDSTIANFSDLQSSIESYARTLRDYQNEIYEISELILLNNLNLLKYCKLKTDQRL